MVDAFQVRDAIEQAAELESCRVDDYDWVRLEGAVRAELESAFGFRHGYWRMRG